MVAAPGGSAHGFGIAADIRGMSPSARASLSRFGLHTPMPWEPWHVEPSETLSATSATAAQRRESFRSFVGGQQGVVSNAVSNDDLSNLQEARDRFTRLNEAAAQFGTEGVRAKAYWDTFYASSKDGDARKLEAEQAANQAVKAHNIELQKAATIQDEQTKGIIRTADAFKQSEAAGYQAMAAEQARVEVMRQGGDVGLRQRQILEESAAAAIQSGQRQVAAALPQIAAQERIAAAASQGAAAQHEAEIVAAAAARTQDALAKAEASRNPVLIAQARALNEAALAEERRKDAALQSRQILERINSRNDQIAVLQLQTGLAGQTPEVIAAATARLQEQQNLLARGVDLSSDIAKKSLENVDALSRANIQLAAATRESQRWDDVFRTIGDSISRFIGDAIEGIFDKKRVIDWSQTFRSALSSIVGQIAQTMLIRPLTGEILGALGASANVVNGFGTFGGGGTAGSSGSSLGNNLMSIGGLAKDIFGLGGGSSSSGGGLFGGVTNFLNNNLGTSLGFAPSSTSTLSLAGAGDVFSTASAAQLQAAGLGPSGSLFGGTTFTGALGGIGLGAGAGGLVSSLLGGNSMFGSLGGGALGLAGTLIGGPIGGILGGALGGLFGLFGGNKKPRNQSAGANFDLSNFELTAGFSGGNQQIDQATQQLAQGIQQFLALLKTTGGALSGNVLLQNGVNTGITAFSTLPGFEGDFRLGKDPGAALEMIQLALARSLTGISDSMKQVIDQIGDPAEIQAAIAFATAYDNLSEAAADAFKSVEAGKNEIGPFATAMGQITTIFQGLTDQANRFGLALDPINAALAEATSRLQGDFLDALKASANEAGGTGFINQLQSVYDDTMATIRESQAIGLGEDPETQRLIRQVYESQLATILSGLDQVQLNEVVNHFTGLNEAIVSLAMSAGTATQATEAAAQAAEAQAQATESLAAAQQLAAQTAQAQSQIQAYLNQLNATPGTFVSPENALAASQSQYQAELAKAQAGDIDALLGITAAADAFIRNIETYYASSLTGQQLVDTIEQELQALVGVQGAPRDPAVVTNELLTQQVAKTDQLNTTVVAGADQTVLTITRTTQSLIDANNTAAADAISQNKVDAQALIAANYDAAADAIAANEVEKAALIASNNQTASDIILQNHLSAQNLIAATGQSTADIVAQNEADSQALIAANDQGAASIIAQNAADSQNLIAANDQGTSSIIAQNEAALSYSIAANDNATLRLLTEGAASTVAILAGSSADATAIGLVMQNVGNQLAQVNTSLANTNISALTTSANAIIEAERIYADGTVASVYGAASSIVQGAAGVGNSQITALYDIANDILVNENNWGSAQITGTYGAASSIIQAAAVYSSNEISAIYGAVNSHIGSAAVFSSGEISAIYGAANSIIATEAIFANNHLIAISTASASNDNLARESNNWLKAINDTTHNWNTYLYEQGSAQLAVLKEIRDKIGLLSSAPPDPPPFNDPGPG
jgi:hypothetical protein